MSTYTRSTVDLTQAQCEDALSLLPITARSKNVFAPYSDVNFKHVPKWGEAQQYVPCLARILQHSGGLRINQVSFFQGAKKFNEDRKLDINEKAIEEGSYRVRAILCQLANMKTKKRSPPRSWQKLFDPILAMITANESMAMESSPLMAMAPPLSIGNDPDCMIVEPKPKPPVQVICLDDDFEDQPAVKLEMHVLESDHPELQKLLQGEPDDTDIQPLQDTIVADGGAGKPGKKRRLTSKTTDQTRGLVIDGIKVSSFADLAGPP